MKCKNCKKELNENNLRCFGEYEEGKKIWCLDCWKELKEYLKQKWFEEKIPKIKAEVNVVLKQLEVDKKHFCNLVKQTKRFLTSLETLEKQKNGNVDIVLEQTDITAFKSEEK